MARTQFSILPINGLFTAWRPSPTLEKAILRNKMQPNVQSYSSTESLLVENTRTSPIPEWFWDFRKVPRYRPPDPRERSIRDLILPPCVQRPAIRSNMCYRSYPSEPSIYGLKSWQLRPVSVLPSPSKPVFVTSEEVGAERKPRRGG